MKVQATKMGYYDKGRKKPGVVFEVKDESDFSPKWMQKVEVDEETQFVRVLKEKPLTNESITVAKPKRGKPLVDESVDDVI